MADNNLVYALNDVITGPGSLGIGNIKDEGRIRFVTSGAGAANLIRVRARITNQPTWVTLVDLTGNVNQSIDVFTYDQLEVICLVYDPNGGNNVRIIASSFDGSSISIELPDGSVLGAVSSIAFTSTDNSISFSADANTGEIDLRAIGGSATIPSVQDFTTVDWFSNAGNYEFPIPANIHSKGVHPIFQVFEFDGFNHEEVEISAEVNGNGDITLIVPQSPDLRFAGKIVIT